MSTRIPPWSRITSVAGDDKVVGNEAAGQVVITGTTTNVEAGRVVTITLPNGSTATATVQADGSWQASVAGSSFGADGTKPVLANVSNLAGTAATQASRNVIVEAEGPQVTAVAISSAIGALGSTLNAGDELRVTVTLSAATTVDGQPELAINMDGTTVQARYLSGSGTTSLVFAYTVQAGQTDLDGIAIAANSLSLAGGALSSAAGNPATLTHGAVSANASYKVDTTSATVTLSSSKSALKVGETALISFSFSEDPGSSFSNADIVVSGGTLGTVSSSGLVRTATFTPTANLAAGSASITVTAGSTTDAAGNAGGAGSSPTISIDTLAPTLAITSSLAQLRGGQTATLTLTFSEEPLGFALGDISASAGSVSNLTVSPTNPKLYTATYTPATNAALSSPTITVAGAGYTDLAGNAGVAAASLALSVDTQAPTVTITSDKPLVGSGQTALITLRFSEDPGASLAWNGSTGDLAVSGGTLSAISGTGLSRTATFTPTPGFNGNASITVTAASYTDAYGNTGSAGASPTLVVDTLAPTVTISSSASALKSGQTATVSFTFSEAPASFSADDIVTTLGTLSGLAVDANNPLLYTATLTPRIGVSGSATIAVTSASYTDAAGNAGSASSTHSVAVDTVAPTVLISSSSAALKSGETATLTFAFSEDPGSSFIAGDLAVTGGTLGALSGSGLSRSAVFTPTAGLASGLVSITLAGANYLDAAGNTGTNGITPVISIDTLAPTLAITSGVSSVKAGETALITFSFSEAPSGFVLGDIVVSGGTLGALSGAGLTRTATFTPTDGLTADASITVASGQYTDAAGNAGGAGLTPALQIRTAAPTVAITSNLSQLKSGDVATLTFTFSADPGASFAAGDLVVSGGTLGAISGSGLTRSASFTPTAAVASGTASIALAAGSYTDTAGNLGAAGSIALSVDTLAPTLAITSSSNALKAGQTATITFSFSEDPGSSFASSDIVVNGGTLGTLSGSGLSRTAVFTPAAGFNGNASITVAAGAYTDAALNAGGQGLSPAISVDQIAPTLVITVDDAALKRGEVAAVSFSFSEAVSGFAATDVVVANGSLTGFAGSQGTYTATFTPTTNLASGNGSITVAAGTYTDMSGNSGAAGATPVIAIDTLAPTLVISATGTTALAKGETRQLTFTFSEDPGSSFSQSNGSWTITGGTLGSITGSGLTRSAVFTPQTNFSGDATLVVTKLPGPGRQCRPEQQHPQDPGRCR